MLTDQEINERFEEMNHKCMLYRGTIIHHMVDLETDIENLISDFFCEENGEKRDILLHVLVASSNGYVTLHAKAAILSYIMQNFYQDFIKTHPEFLDSLNELVEIRNTVAHRKFTNTMYRINNYDGKNIYIEWTKVKNGNLQQKELQLNEEIVEQLSNRIIQLVSDLYLLKEGIT